MELAVPGPFCTPCGSNNTTENVTYPWAIAGYGNCVFEGNCLMSHNTTSYPEYDTDYECAGVPLFSGTVQLFFFDTEDDFDILIVDSLEFSGLNPLGLDGYRVEAGVTRFHFQSDVDETAAGFRLCIV